MALRNAARIWIKNFLGLQSFSSPENVGPQWWTDSSNFIVSNDGSAAQLRSPANFNTALSVSNPVYSGFDYDKNSGNLILFDCNIGSVGISSVRTFSTTGGANTTIRSNQADVRWKSLTINDMAYRLNGSEFIQTDGTNVYSVGITAPAAAPTVSFTSGGSGSLSSGVTVSYAYRNSTTGHVSTMSAASSASGASTTNLTLRVAVTASSQTGVDGIVLFITKDGGAIRYLYVDTSGDPVVSSNATGNIDISLANVDNLDTSTPETAYNGTSPQNAFFMFQGRNKRLYLLDFRGATTRQQIQYNVSESCYYGIPWESWDSRNVINIPNKSDAARSGIATPIGDLILGERDAYLIRGAPTDKISGPQNVVAITESIQSLKWSIGTRSPYSLVSTPYGEIWWDQNKRIQMWDHSATPVEIGLPIRTTLDAGLDTAAARNMAEGCWYQHGDNGGVYVLTFSTSGSTNNRLVFVTAYRDPEDGQMRFACSTSDIAAQCVFTARISGTDRLFIGVTDRIREIMDLDLAGAGWSSTQSRFFEITAGNDDEFCYWHSIRFDATSIVGLTVRVANLDDTEPQWVEIENQGGVFYGALDTYGFRKVIRFEYDPADTAKRIIKNVRLSYSQKARML